MMKKIIFFLSGIITMTAPVQIANAQLAVAVAANTDPTFLSMAAKSIATNAQQLSQLADVVQTVQTNYQMINSTNDIVSKFSSFSNIFAPLSNYMNDYVCSDCTPQQVSQWDQLKTNLKSIDGDLCKNVANILANGGKISGNISTLAQDVQSIMNTNMSAMTPAQTAATQARLIGSLATGVQQTNVLLNSAMQMQTAQTAKQNMKEKSTEIMGNGVFQNFSKDVRP
ncbi:MAG: hypothetical protein EKK54_06175 [Neisseriaceae bacterium]|nr:MAG: hypothetical protein EKK54_06175 [Neisseriaceae bacterium]